VLKAQVDGMKEQSAILNNFLLSTLHVYTIV
jgi:hypothetical protein